ACAGMSVKVSLAKKRKGVMVAGAAEYAILYGVIKKVYYRIPYAFFLYQQFAPRDPGTAAIQFLFHFPGPYRAGGFVSAPSVVMDQRPHKAAIVVGILRYKDFGS